MKAVVKKEPKRGVDIIDVPIPQIGENDILVQVKASGICGSDVHVYEWAGGYDWLTPHLPRILGHEFSGVVVETGKKVTKVNVGDRVLARTSLTGPCGVCEYCRTGRRHFCTVHHSCLTGWKADGGFAEYFRTTENGVVILPEQVSYEQGALAEPVSIGTCAVYDANLMIGDTCVIIGPGTIGLLTLIVAKSAGAGKCIVCGTGKDGKRLEMAKALGADEIINSDQVNMYERIMELTDGQGADIVFEASGAVSVIQPAIESTKKASGRVILEGIYSKNANIELSNDIVRSARMIRGTYSGPIAWERTVAWLANNRESAEKCTKIITHRTNINDAVEAFERCVRKENIKEIFTSFC